MADSKIVFDKLILEGFGPYKEPSIFVFNEGINRFVAENETGKTSMMAGVIATLFGLTHRVNAVSAFNLERFRNWNQPSACKGCLFLRSGGIEYKIQRDFDNHQVAIWQIGNENIKEKCLVEGAHNPQARKPLKLYDEKLNEILGFSSQDLFEDIFFVAQPLPEVGQISSNLQGLLSGGSGASFSDILESLSSDLKRITKYTGPNHRGITARNMGKDGELESTEHEMVRISELLSSAQQDVDQLLTVRNDIRDLEDKSRIVREEIDKKDKTLAAWSSWNNCKKDYEISAAKRDALKFAHASLSKSISELEQITNALALNYPEFERADSNTEDILRSMMNLKTFISKASETVESLRIEIEAKEQENAGCNKFLEGHSSWKELGEDPVGKVRMAQKNSQKCIRDWNNFQDDLKVSREISEQLNSTYTVFEQAAPEAIEKLKGYEQFKTKIEFEILDAERDLKSGEVKIEVFTDKQKKHAEINLEFADFTEETKVALEQKWKFLKDKRELEREMDNFSEKKTVPAALRFGSGSALSIIAFLAIGTGNLIMLLMGIVLAFLVGVAASTVIYKLLAKKELSPKETKRQEIESLLRKISDLDKALGKYANMDDMDLVQLMEKMRRFKDEQKTLEVEKQEIDKIDLQKLSVDLQAIKDRKKEYEDVISKLLNAYPKPMDAYEEWKSASQNLERINKNTEDFSRNHFGCVVSEIEKKKATESMPENQWNELAEILNLLNYDNKLKSIVSLRDLIERTKELSTQWWEQKTADAAQYAEQTKRAVKSRDDINRINESLAVETEKYDKLTVENAAMEEEMKSILEVHSNDPEEALKKLKKFEGEKKRINDKETEIQILLRQFKVEDIEQLNKSLGLSEDEVHSSMNNWKNHINKFPGLPDISEAGKAEAIQSRIEEIRKSITTLKDEVNLAGEELRSRNQVLGRLEGANPINIAIAELEKQELVMRKENLELQADALALAYREMDAAIKDFNQSYQTRLEEKATDYFSNISNNMDRQITLDDQLNIGIEERGRKIPLDSLSRGAKDQMYLSLRFAIADLITEDYKLPFVFDDSFTNTDEIRLERIRTMLEKQKENRQFFILAHSDYYNGWGDAIRVE